MKNANETGQAIAEMWFLSSWKMRFKLMKKLRKEHKFTRQQLSAMVMLGGFADICRFFYGRDWLNNVIKNKEPW